MSEPSHERLMLTDASYKAGYSRAHADLQAQVERLKEERDSQKELAERWLNERDAALTDVDRALEQLEQIETERDDWKRSDGIMRGYLQKTIEERDEANRQLAAAAEQLNRQALSWHPPDVHNVLGAQCPGCECAKDSAKLLVGIPTAGEQMAKKEET